jgi:tRNA(Ile)-lysidine synthetase-like protein
VTPNPASDPLLRALAAAAAQHSLFPAHPDITQPVIVAVSGGADSVCLLHALVQLAGAWGLALHVAHIDHRLRPQSGEDSRFVAELAAQYGLPLHVTRLDPAALRADRRGLEAAARHARYTSLCAVARAVSPPKAVPCVAVAHHADDQAETVLLRLACAGCALSVLRPCRPCPVNCRCGWCARCWRSRATIFWPI